MGGSEWDRGMMGIEHSTLEEQQQALAEWRAKGWEKIGGEWVQRGNQPPAGGSGQGGGSSTESSRAVVRR